MTTDRTIKPTIALLALFAAWPAVATANPLLSGYGGPGEGSQAIIGSTLLNGPGSGGGGSAGAGGRSTGNASGAAVEGARTSGTTLGSRSAANSAGSHATAERAGRTAPVPSGNGPRPSPASPGGLLSTRAPVGAETLGLSHEDLLYILLALGAIAFTGVLTRRLTRAAATESHGS